jgi:hypothetical protein
MQDSKFFALLRTLDKEELMAFEKQVKKLHSEEAITLSVFMYIKKYFPDLRDEKKLDIAFAYRKIFGEDIEATNYNRKKLLNALSDLNVWLRDFLLEEELKKDSFDVQSLWLRVLQKRKMKTEFIKNASILQQEIESFPKKAITDYMKGMNINYWFYNQYTHDNTSPDINALKRCGNDLDLYYAITRLKVACEMANLNNLFSLEFDMNIMPLIIELSKKHLTDEHPLLLLYLELYQLITARQDDSYAQIVKMLTESVEKINSDELHAILSHLYN